MGKEFKAEIQNRVTCVQTPTKHQGTCIIRFLYRQNKLNNARQNKLIMVQLNKLNLIHHKKLNIVQLNKLTKERELWRAHMKSWQNPLMP